MAQLLGNSLSLGCIRGGVEVVHMSAAERARHTYIVGATRTGKSKLLEDCIRQDILAWPRSGCGMLVIDRHGSLYDNTVKWAAARDLSSWPIVPIDLRRDDWIVSFNPLRRRGRGEDDSVIVGNCVRSIMHSCGHTNFNETPRLMKWLEAFLTILFTNNLTLAEALQLIASPGVRHSLAANVEDFAAQSIWRTAPPREADFQEVLESTVNRIRRFLSRKVMQATLGQTEASLDLGQALDDGQIILACIATEGAKIDEEDAATIGSLLLSDIWMAAKARGKRDEGELKPYYVYLDEFQEFISPAMAETLDQAAGFGLHMTLAHQFPSQLLKNDQGKQLYNSVLANCRNRIVFQLEHNKDVEELALMLHRQEVDPYKVKHEIVSTKVLGYNLTYMPSFGTGSTEGVGGGVEVSHTRGENHTIGTNWSHTDTVSDAYTETSGWSEGVNVGVSETDTVSSGSNVSHARSLGRSDAVSETDGSTWDESEGTSLQLGTGESRSEGTGTSRHEGASKGTSETMSESVTFRRPTKTFQKDLAEYQDGNLSEGNEEAFKRSRAQSTSITEGEGSSDSSSTGLSTSRTTGLSTSRSENRGLSHSRSAGGNRSHGLTHSASEGQDDSVGSSRGISHGETLSIGLQSGISGSESITHGTSSADTYGGSESWGTSSAITRGRNRSWTRANSKTHTLNPILIPQMGQEVSSVTFETIQEQLFRFAQYLAGQPDRCCVVKLVSKMPVPMVTLTVNPGRTTDEWVFAWVTSIVQGLKFALPMKKALDRIAERHKAIRAKILGADDSATTAIPLNAVPHPAGANGKRFGGV